MIGRSPDIEGTRSVTEIHCGIVVGNKEENNMVDSGQYEVSGDDFASKLLERYNSL